jgi:nucleotide-binding universal stress UspA family protein
MSLTAIVSYDDTANDHDALTLARVFGDAGAKLVLAYVRHTTNAYRKDGQIAEDAAQALLDRGAAQVDGAETRVVVHGKTSEGLRALVEVEHADVIVFGSEYRTANGRVAPQLSTQAMYENGPAALAIAPSGYVAKPIQRIGLLADLGDHAAIDTAHSFAKHFGATVTNTTHDVDLLIVGSRKEATAGTVMLSSQAQNTIDGATAPVLVTAREVALSLESPLYVA